MQTDRCGRCGTMLRHHPTFKCNPQSLRRMQAIVYHTGAKAGPRQERRDGNTWPSPIATGSVVVGERPAPTAQRSYPGPREGAPTMATPTRTLDEQLAYARREAERLFDATASLDAAEAAREPHRTLVFRFEAACRAIERLQHAIWLRDGAPAGTAGAGDGTLDSRLAGITRREKAEVGTMEAMYSGDFRETSYTGYLWRCDRDGCGLVWPKQRQADGCQSRKHVASYQDGPYGCTGVLNGVPQGNLTYYTRAAVRREKVGA